MKKNINRLPNKLLEREYLKSYSDIKKIHWSRPVTVVILQSGKKGLSRVQKGDKWSRELGFWVAYAKVLRKRLPKHVKVKKMLAHDPSTGDFQRTFCLNLSGLK